MNEPSHTSERSTVPGTSVRGGSIDGYLPDLVRSQCEAAPAEAGAYVRLEADHEATVLAIHPAPRRGQSAPAWIAHAVKAAAESRAAGGVHIASLEMGEPFSGAGSASIIIVPVGGGEDPAHFGLFLTNAPTHMIHAIAQRLLLTTGLVEVLKLRRGIEDRDRRQDSVGRVLTTLALVGEHHRADPAMMALCGAVAAEWRAARVSLGLVRGRSVVLRAISHTDKVVRKTALAQDLEAAMEECADQDLEVAWPSGAEMPVIARAHAELAGHHGAKHVLSLPLRDRERVVGVLTVERDADEAFGEDEAASLRMLCELVTKRIVLLERHGWRWPLRVMEEAAGAVVGPRYVWQKLAGVAVFANVLFLLFVPGTFRVEGTFRLDAIERRVVAAPYDGYIRDVFVEVGDVVAEPGAPLAKLDDTELRLRLATLEAEIIAHQREAAIAQRDRKEAESQIARAKADQTTAQAALIRYRIDQSTVTAPIHGVVLSGDLMRLRGSPVRAGDVLFELAPIESMHADLYVPEDRVADVMPGMRGELATAAFPDRRIGFTVERVEPAAEIMQGKNVFRARVALEQTAAWMRPGMEGVGRVDVDRRPYGRIWFRRAADWVRMRLWI